MTRQKRKVRARGAGQSGSASRRKWSRSPYCGVCCRTSSDALYDSVAMRAFAGIYLAVENVPVAITPLKFRCLLVGHDLTREFCEHGLKEGTLVDATIIALATQSRGHE